jgi:hypothetical protein
MKTSLECDAMIGRIEEDIMLSPEVSAERKSVESLLFGVLVAQRVTFGPITK